MSVASTSFCSVVAVIDLFAGAGGFGIGAREAKCKLRLSVELDSTAVQTLKKNKARGHHVLLGDVSGFSGLELRESAKLKQGQSLIVVGGPPCQPFSKGSNWIDSGADHEYRKEKAAGKAPEKPDPPEARPDHRRNLLDEFARLVIDSDADGFVFENVPAVNTQRNRPVLQKMIRKLKKAGFYIEEDRCFASEFGVAQHRERIFVLGSKNSAPQRPKRSHWAKIPDETLEAPRSVKEVCAPFQGPEFHEEETIVHPRETYYKHLMEISPGKNYKELTEWAHYHERRVRAFRKAPFTAERRYWNFLLVLDPDKPSWTIPAVYGSWNGPFHWRNTPSRFPRRRLRTTEIAAIQGFPSDYEIVGNWRAKVRQLGNAVPPAMAAAMITEVKKTLQK